MPVVHRLQRSPATMQYDFARQAMIFHEILRLKKASSADGPFKSGLCLHEVAGPTAWFKLRLYWRGLTLISERNMNMNAEADE